MKNKNLYLLLIIIIVFNSCSIFSSGKKSNGTTDFEKILTNAKRKVFPSLVYIKPIREEFGAGEKKQQEVFGSGVIISPDGYVVTNNHVAEKAIQIYCVLYDKIQYNAEIVGLDPETDLALLKIIPLKNDQIFPYSDFGDSDKVEEGQFVMALGSPFGFTRSISLGIISNVNRYIGFDTQYKYNTWIQTDAAINPGNSGGPLVNKDGKIIGINTLGLGFFAEGMAFSIPSNVVMKIVERLKNDSKVIRSYTGLQIQALKDFMTNTFSSAEKGVLIQSVDSDSPAGNAGVQPGDILLSINNENVNGVYVEDLPAIRWKMADLKPEVPAEFFFLRNGEQKKILITPVLKDKFEGEDLELKRWNMTVKEISKFSTPDLYFIKKKGVFIQGVKYPGNAAKAGLQRNDIIIKIDNKTVESISEVNAIYESLIKDTKREKKVLIEVLRRSYSKLIVIDYRQDYNEE